MTASISTRFRFGGDAAIPGGIGLHAGLRHAFFNPLGKLADRAIYFACVNFFFFYYEQSYLSIYWTIFTIFSPNGRYLREFS